MSDKVYVGKKCATFQSHGEYEPFSRVTMWYDDEHFYTAGDDTGRTLECENPWATQAIVDNVLRQVKGYVYRPFEATGVEIDPAFELGDAVTIGGIYSVIGSMTQRFDAMGLCDIAAKGGKEIDHEYPYKSPQERAMKRKVSLEQKYFGAKISRREGLVIEKIEKEVVKARVVLNAEKLAFYDGESQEQLYFDPGAGCYKFRGMLNVNDNFVVDKLGNVTMKGSINMSNGSITWGGNIPNKKRYAASTGGPWHDTMQSGDIYCCDWDYQINDWGTPYQFVGVDGAPGSNGSDASVTRGNIVRAMLQSIDEDGLYTTTVNGKQCLGINATAIRSGIIDAIDIYGSTFYSASRLDSSGNPYPVASLRLADGYEDGYSDLVFKNLPQSGGGGGYEMFKVRDEMGSASMWLYGVKFAEASLNAGGSIVLGPKVEVTARFG